MARCLEKLANIDQNLVYSGYGSTGGEYAHDLKVQQYNGEPHLTFYEGNDGSEGNRGHGVIMDSSYAFVKTVNSGLGRAPIDVHEFTLLDNGNAITTIFQPTQYDLSNYGLNQPVCVIPDAQPFLLPGLGDLPQNSHRVIDFKL